MSPEGRKMAAAYLHLRWNPPTWILITATLCGALLAALGLIQTEARPDDAIALVNDQIIERVEFERAIAAISADKRTVVAPEDRDRVLNRLIEEELLIQRAREIGLVDRDRSIRNAVISAMIQHSLEPSRAQPVNEETLKQWYADNQQRFQPQPQLRIKRLSREGGRQTVPIPDTLLPLSKLQDYIGPDAANALAAVPEQDLGSEIGPIEGDASGNLYRILERQQGAPPVFEEVREGIEIAYRRAQGDQDFRAYLNWLERRAVIKKLDTVKR